MEPTAFVLRATFVSLRDHRDGKDFVESLVVGDAVECLLVRTAKSDCDEIERRRDRAKDFPSGLSTAIPSAPLVVV